jgi:hypothetical protein
MLTFFVFVCTLATWNAYLRLSGEEQLRAAVKCWKKKEHERGEIVQNARNEAIGRMLGFVLESLEIVFISGGILLILGLRALYLGDAIAGYVAGGWLVATNYVNFFVVKRGSGMGINTRFCVHLVDWVNRVLRPRQPEVIETREVLLGVHEVATADVHEAASANVHEAGSASVHELV